MQTLSDDSSRSGQYLQDMGLSWKPVLSCLGVGIVLTVIFMYTLAKCTNCMAFLSILIIELALMAGAGLAAYNGIYGSAKHIMAYWGVFIVLFFLLIVFNLILCCLRKKI